MASKIKAFVISLLGGAGVGAGVTYATKQTLTETTENIVPLTKDNVTTEIMFKALQQKWATKNAQYGNNVDLSVRENWLELVDNFKTNHQSGYANVAYKDINTLLQIERGEMHFPEFLNQQKLSEYISTQDATESVRDHVTAMIHQSIQNQYGIDLNGKKVLDDEAIANSLSTMTNADQVNELMEKVDLWQAWNGQTDYNVDFDQFLGDYSASEIANMSATEKAQHAMEKLDTFDAFKSRGGYTPDSLLDIAHNTSDKGQLEILIQHYRDYMYAKGVTEGDYQNLEVGDALRMAGDTDVANNPDYIIVCNSRKEILEDGIEQKFNLKKDSVNLWDDNYEIAETLPGETKKEFIDNVMNSTSYLQNMGKPTPVTDEFTTTQQIEALGVGDQIDAMIANGETIDLGAVSQPISDELSFKFGGIGAGVTFAALYIIQAMRARKIKKICAVSPEATDNLNNYMEEQRKKQEYKKILKHAKRQAKHTKVVENDEEQIRMK